MKSMSKIRTKSKKRSNRFFSLNKKIRCAKCNVMAVWKYMPGDKCYCENHVPRGCSCVISEDGVVECDDQGREFPCCEYHYFPSGILQN